MLYRMNRAFGTANPHPSIGDQDKFFLYTKVNHTFFQNVNLKYTLTNLITYYLLTYLLAPWSIVLLEKLIGSQLVKKFPALFGNRSFIPAFTSARHLSLS